MLPSKKIFEGSFSNGMNPNQIHRTPKALKRTLAAKTPLACLIDLTETKCYSPSHVWRFVSPMDCGRRDRLPTPVFLGFPCGSAGKESACNVGDLGSIPALGRSPGEGNGNPLQYSCLQNPIDREAWYLSLISEPTPLSASLSFDPICRASPMV